jgi:transposase
MEHAELARRCERAEAQLKAAGRRILELERLLMRYLAHDRSAVRAKHELEQGQPLLDLAEGREAAEGKKEEEDEEEEEETEAYAPSGHKPRRRGRRKYPEHLPREVKEYGVDPGEDLPDYDASKGHKIIDHDSCEELVVPKTEPKVIVHRRPVVLYQTLGGEARVVTVGGMSKVFPKCAASPEVLARVAVERLHYHLTLYRIERWFAEMGCPLSRSTLSLWMQWLGKLLRPLRSAQEKEIEAAFKRHADDTEMRVLAEGECERVRVWVVLGEVNGGGKEIIFKQTEARTAASTQGVLGAHRGYLQVDACGAYDDLYAEGKLIEVGCWSHVRRKFEDVVAVDSRAGPMLKLIRRLYAVDSWGAGLQPAERRIYRLLAARPIVAQIGNWVTEQRNAELVESSFKKALNYVFNQWNALKRFLEDGRLSLDNNVAEAEFHVLGVGRRNYLFWGSREGLTSGLVLFGLIRSCVANGIDPYQYLVDVIRRVAADAQTPARLLIPSRWKQLPPLPPSVSDRTPAQAAVVGTG